MDLSLIKSRLAAGAIAANRLVKRTANRGEAAQAAASTDAIAGVSDGMGASAAGQMCDVHELGLYDVVAGGNLAAGDPVTSDANGKAVKAVKPGAGVRTFCAGTVQEPAVIDDIVPIMVAPFVIDG